jgi:hypothetical protein
MAVRAWQDDESELRVPIIAESMIADDVTIAVLVRPIAKTSVEIIMVGRDAAGDDQWSFGTDSSNIPFFFTSNGSQTVKPSIGGALTDGVWSLVAFTKSGPGGPRRFHILELGGSWQHISGDLGGSATTPVSTTGGFIGFGFFASNDDLNALMAIAGIWNTALTDAQVEALGANLTSSDWSAHEITPSGAWNFDQTTNTDNVPDLTGNHATITGTITSGTDRNGITGTTIVVGSDPPGWDFTAAPPSIRWSYRFSGGASNADPALSIGGAESSEEIQTALLEDFGRPAAISGVTRYAGLYVHNDSDDQPASVVAYFSALSLSAGVSVAFAVATQAAGVALPTLASSSTAPAGVTFSTPVALENAVSLGTINGGQGKGLWIRVIIDPHAAGALHNEWEITTVDTPL